MKPTAEQLEAVERFRGDGALKINAFAGTGKTTTLRLLANSTSRRGMYLAFNRSIAAEASEKFPTNVNCSTVHSLAFRATPKEFRHGDKMTGSLNANAFADHLGYEDHFVGGVKLSARQQGHLARETLRRFLQGGRSHIEDRHLPNLDEFGSLATLDDEHRRRIEQQALRGATAIWGRMRDPRDPLPLGHDGYLKLWALSEPRLSTDFILLDEAQDTNPVVLGVLARQQAQIVYVGDRHQQIYEWRGALNAMDLARADHTTYLTTSFRFGERIAAAASNVLKHLDETRALTGNPNCHSFIGSNDCDAILARTNASVMSSVISELTIGRKPHVVGGTNELLRMLRGVQDLKRNKSSDVPEFFGFAAWNEVVEFSAEPAGQQLKTFVSLVEKHGEERLINTLSRTADDEETADVVISTAHKAKGREWETVRLTDDFLPSKPESDEVDPSEIRLFYVALTRARTAVDFSTAVMGRFGIADGPRFSKPKVSKLKEPGTQPASRPDAHRDDQAKITPAQHGRSTRSKLGEKRARPKETEGLGLPWWLVGVGILVLFYLLAG
nr:UvrD-helicase domain-containing protein [Aminobacter aminovorans]